MSYVGNDSPLLAPLLVPGIYARLEYSYYCDLILCYVIIVTGQGIGCFTYFHPQQRLNLCLVVSEVIVIIVACNDLFRYGHQMVLLNEGQKGTSKIIVLFWMKIPNFLKYCTIYFHIQTGSINS